MCTRKSIWAGLLVLAAVSPAVADLTVTGYGFGLPADDGSRGGEFVVSVDAPAFDNASGVWRSLPSNFRTFCLEKGEHLAGSGPFDIELNDKALYNNISGGSNPLSGQTAALFRKYWNGSLGALSVNSDEKGAAFQNVIWYIEDQIADLYEGFGGNTTVMGYIDDYWDLVDDIPDDASIGNVRVINMWVNGHAGEFDWRRQDLLVCIPAPGVALLSLLGLGMVGWLKRQIA